jgi:hypothetical protein
VLSLLGDFDLRELLDVRAAVFLLVTFAPLCGGCSILIARAGKDATQLTNKEQVRNDLGEPTKSGIEQGWQYDEYHTHRKFAEPCLADLHSMSLGYSFGLGEFILFPAEIFALTGNLLFGRDIRFYYDERGNVVHNTLEIGKLLVPAPTVGPNKEAADAPPKDP